MGVVIRMNMAAGLGRAELSPGCSEKQMSVDPHLPSMLGRWSVRSQLWSPQGHCTSGARKIIGFFSWFTVSPGSSLALSLPSLCNCLVLMPKSSRTKTCTRLYTFSTNTNISGTKNKYETLIWRSKVLAGLPSWIVTQTGKVKGCVNINTRRCIAVAEREIGWNPGNEIWCVCVYNMYIFGILNSISVCVFAARQQLPFLYW